MRDLHMLTSRKHLIMDIDDATQMIRKRYPTAMREGSVGSYHWVANDIIVGESWLHRNGKYWWLRIKVEP